MKIGIIDQNLVVPPPVSVRPTALSVPSYTVTGAFSAAITVPAGTVMMAVAIALRGGGLDAIVPTLNGVPLTELRHLDGSTNQLWLGYIMNSISGLNLAFDPAEAGMNTGVCQVWNLKDAVAPIVANSILDTVSPISMNLTLLENAYVFGAIQSVKGSGGSTDPSWTYTNLTTIDIDSEPSVSRSASVYNNTLGAGSHTFAIGSDWDSNFGSIAAVYSG